MSQRRCRRFGKRSTPDKDKDMSSQIPVVSLNPIIRGEAAADETVARDVEAALGSWGAFELVDHGVPTTIIDAVFAAAATFFKLPLETRMQIKVDKHKSKSAAQKVMCESSYPVADRRTIAAAVARAQPRSAVDRGRWSCAFKSGRGASGDRSG